MWDANRTFAARDKVVCVDSISMPTVRYGIEFHASSMPLICLQPFLRGDAADPELWSCTYINLHRDTLRKTALIVVLLRSYPEGFHYAMPLTVVVVGAGIGGLAAAIALRQAGCEVTILERRHSITEIGYAIDVPPNATRILKRWGMDLNKLRGCHQYRLDVIKADVNPMKLLLSEERDIGGDAPFISVHRVDYHEALKEMALDEKAPGRPAVLRCNSKVTAYDPETGSVTLDSGDSIKADVIIAADGSGSKAHRWVVGEDLPAKPNGINNLRFVVPSSVMMQDPGMRTLVEATKGKMCVYVDSSGNYIAHYACREYVQELRL